MASRALLSVAAVVWRLGVVAHDALWLPLGVSGWLFDRAEATDRRVECGRHRT